MYLVFYEKYHYTSITCRCESLYKGANKHAQAPPPRAGCWEVPSGRLCGLRIPKASINPIFQMTKPGLREVKRVARDGTARPLKPCAVSPKPTLNLLVSFHLYLRNYISSLTQLRCFVYDFYSTFQMSYLYKAFPLFFLNTWKWPQTIPSSR